VQFVADPPQERLSPLRTTLCPRVPGRHGRTMTTDGYVGLIASFADRGTSLVTTDEAVRAWWPLGTSRVTRGGRRGLRGRFGRQS
jgi:hypothetical protein